MAKPKRKCIFMKDISIRPHSSTKALECISNRGKGVRILGYLSLYFRYKPKTGNQMVILSFCPILLPQKTDKRMSKCLIMDGFNKQHG
ncbi:hypothetical protein FKM82_002018 [Ascaphus truei]